MWLFMCFNDMIDCHDDLLSFMSSVCCLLQGVAKLLMLSRLANFNTHLWFAHTTVGFPTSAVVTGFSQT